MMSHFRVLALLLGLGGVAASSADRVYTSLDPNVCRTVEQDTESEFIRQLCPGVARVTLEVSEGDLRTNVRVRTANGRWSDLRLMELVSSGFSSLGPRAEWVVGRGVPLALILRYNASEVSEAPERLTSYLVVSKVTGTGVCVVGVVKPSAQANVRARALAEQAGGRPCLRAP
ncbi:hypothetical protein [Deinococcus maricopensis]|uniref:Secreted protein n=1 Tax=Deinococcus maricopensis (strain DSM 21211 / LMG 22137 / NRRL B-23946 / LB-34) TaxID=709986 RepID=E8UAQ5_DEIML|nr:hypothetical protein [Deinococcus maricopensis]ADV68144.1 hypothetical protein Deima_2509 [Deinococcus maricopensis DSM 21211]